MAEPWRSRGGAVAEPWRSRGGAVAELWRSCGGVFDLLVEHVISCPRIHSIPLRSRLLHARLTTNIVFVSILYAFYVFRNTNKYSYLTMCRINH